MSEQYKVSIIISSWSYGKYLKGAIDSALKQTVPCKVVVFDNASTDLTKNVIAKYNNIVKLRTEKFIEWCPLLNKLIKEQGCEYVILLGADDTIEPEFVEKCLSKMTKDVGIVRTGMKAFGAENWTNIPSETLDLVDEEIENKIPFTSMFRKKAWEQVGGYDEKIPSYEDWDFWIRIMQSGWVVSTVPEALFNYMIHFDSGYYMAVKDDSSIQKYIVNKVLSWHKKQEDMTEWIPKYILSSKKVILDARNDIIERNKLYEDITKEVKKRDIIIEEKSKVLEQIINSKGWKFLETLRKISGRGKNE